jgi:LacI family transcriptional regulator
MKHNTPTMRDVALIAGVSIQTVSAIINHKPGITNETRDRVLQAIQDSGYRPFSVARSLRTRQTNTIALVISDIANPAFSALANAIGDCIYALGYSLIVYSTHNDPEREAVCLQAVSQRWIDGVLFVSTGDPTTGLASLHQARIPVVAIDRIPLNYDGIWVKLDNYRAGVLAAEYFLGLGHTQIAHICGPENLLLSREREEGFRKTITDHGLELVSPANDAKSWACESGYQEMRDILKNKIPVTAIFAASDRLAIGAMHAIRQAGLQIPEDISVMGVDDIELAAYQNPPLTTLRQSFTDLGQQSVEILMNLIHERPIEKSHVFIQPELIIRESTRKI